MVSDVIRGLFDDYMSAKWFFWFFDRCFNDGWWEIMITSWFITRAYHGLLGNLKTSFGPTKYTGVSSKSWMKISGDSRWFLLLILIAYEQYDCWRILSFSLGHYWKCWKSTLLLVDHDLVDHILHIAVGGTPRLTFSWIAHVRMCHAIHENKWRRFVSGRPWIREVQ